MKYAWIEKHRQLYATTMMCDLLSVSRSGLNAARGRAPSKRSREDKQLLDQIRQGQRKHRGRYGRRRMTPEISQALAKRAPTQPVSEIQAELSRLRQENSRLKLEKEILKKAAAYFARESM